MHRVSIVRCPSYDRSEVEARLQELIGHFGGLAAFVQPGDKVLIKPNILTGAPPERAITTHPEVVRAVARACQDLGAHVQVGDCPGFGDSVRAAERAGIVAMCQAIGVPFVSFNTPRQTPFPEGKVAKRFLLAEPVTRADKIISIAKLKTHGLMVYTGAVKNLYGTVSGNEKIRLHLSYPTPHDFALLLLDLQALVRPVLSIVDGIVGMEGSGPRAGTPRQMGLLFAGTEPIAVDTVVAACIGVPVQGVPYLAAAAEAGYDSADLKNIEVAGLGLDEAKVKGFRLPASGPKPDFPLWLGEIGRKQLSARPVLIPDLCQGCAICRESCPPEAIRIEDGRAVFDDRKCIRCYCCHEMCPHGAIELKHTGLGRIWKWR